MKVLLVDDHPLILAALQTVIRGLGDDVTVLGVDSAQAAKQALEHDAGFDLVLLDLQLGDTDGFDVLADLRAAYPALPVVVVSASDRASDVIRAIDAGAMGFVPKHTGNETLFEALRLVMSGGIYVPAMRLGEAPAPRPSGSNGDTVPDVMRPKSFEATSTRAHADALPASLDELGLSKRQAAVLSCLLRGLPNKAIAKELALSVETVKDHVAAVLKLLKVSTRTQAVLAVAQITQQQMRPATAGSAADSTRT